MLMLQDRLLHFVISKVMYLHVHLCDLALRFFYLLSLLGLLLLMILADVLLELLISYRFCHVLLLLGKLLRHLTFESR